MVAIIDNKLSNYKFILSKLRLTVIPKTSVPKLECLICLIKE